MYERKRVGESKRERNRIRKREKRSVKVEK